MPSCSLYLVYAVISGTVLDSPIVLIAPNPFVFDSHSPSFLTQRGRLRMLQSRPERLHYRLLHLSWAVLEVSIPPTRRHARSHLRLAFDHQPHPTHHRKVSRGPTSPGNVLRTPL